MLRVLVACEFSQVVTEAFTKRGHYAISCDFEPAEKNYPHYQGDVLDILSNHWDEFDLMIAHPPCTFLANVGLGWLNPKFAEKFPNRKQDQQRAIDFFMFLAEFPIPKIAVENPVGIMNSIYRKPDQIISPYMFGHRERKKTCLWLKNLPLLNPTVALFDAEEPTYIGKNGRKMYFVDAMSPNKDRAKNRSRTFEGIAKAMAEQWGSL